jgi:hypothetical protein
MEAGIKKPVNGKSPYKIVLKFKMFENHTNSAIQAIIDGEKSA